MSQEPTPQEPVPAAPEPVPVSPDLLAWAQQTFDVQEFLADVRDIETNGGHTFEEVIAAVEAVVRAK